MSDQSDQVPENHSLPFSIQVKEEDVQHKMNEINRKYPHANIDPVRQNAWWFEILVT